MSEAVTTQVPRSRFIKTLLTFALLGPFIGGGIPYLIIILVVLLPAMIQIHGIGNLPLVLGAAFTILMIGMVFAVILAIAPAVVSGFAVASFEYYRGRSRIWWPALFGLLAGLAAAAVYWRFLGWSSDDETLASAVAVVAGSILASIACWWLARPRNAIKRAA